MIFLPTKIKKSFSCALIGLKEIFFQQNFLLMVAMGAGAIFLGFFFGISYFEWLILIFLIGFILVLEALNTIWEKILDFLEPKVSEKIRCVKDMLAGGVLISCFFSIILGGLIFLPKIIIFFKNLK